MFPAKMASPVSCSVYTMANPIHIKQEILYTRFCRMKNKTSNIIVFNTLLFHAFPISTGYNLLLASHYQILNRLQVEFLVSHGSIVYQEICYSFHFSLQPPWRYIWNVPPCNSLFPCQFFHFLSLKANFRRKRWQTFFSNITPSTKRVAIAFTRLQRHFYCLLKVGEKEKSHLDPEHRGLGWTEMDWDGSDSRICPNLWPASQLHWAA